MTDNGVYEATTEGDCDICMLRILPGQLIVRIDMDGDDGYAHYTCTTGETG